MSPKESPRNTPRNTPRETPSEHTRKRGRKGEEIALKALENDGYSIVETNFWTREGEIDIIAKQGGYLCFIEVKARSSRSFGSPEESITPKKQQTIGTVAKLYIEKNEIGPHDMRFDIVTIDLKSGEATVIPNAFELDVQG